MKFRDIASSNENKANQNDLSGDHGCDLQDALLKLNTKHGSKLTRHTVVEWARELKEMGITDTKSIQRYNNFVLERPREKISLKGLVSFIKKDTQTSNPVVFVSETTGKKYPMTEDGYLQEKNEINRKPMTDDEVLAFNKFFKGRSILKKGRK